MRLCWRGAPPPPYGCLKLRSELLDHLDASTASARPPRAARPPDFAQAAGARGRHCVRLRRTPHHATPNRARGRHCLLSLSKNLPLQMSHWTGIPGGDFSPPFTVTTEIAAEAVLVPNTRDFTLAQRRRLPLISLVYPLFGMDAGTWARVRARHR